MEKKKNTTLGTTEEEFNFLNSVVNEMRKQLGVNLTKAQAIVILGRDYLKNKRQVKII